MAPYIGESKTLMKLSPAVASGLLASGVVVEVPEGASKDLVAKIWERKFGAPLADSVAEITPKTPATVDQPRGNASREDWVAYAVTQGISEDDLAGLKQGEIRALLDGKQDDDPKTGDETTEGASDPGTTTVAE